MDRCRSHPCKPHILETNIPEPWEYPDQVKIFAFKEQTPSLLNETT